ncbi:hypothetical protein SESBI_16815 [Sesbania bispinosa]|nr:hypothetical protein SESBI_16815 [Sesbania bispinosa]
MDLAYDTEGELEGATIQLEGEEEESLDLTMRSLVGKILWEKPLNHGAIKQILTKACGEESEDMEITEMGTNMFMFTFQDKRKAKVVMAKGLWNVMGHLISLQYWVPQASVYEINYDLVSFWVKLHGMPLEFMTTSNGGKIAARLGDQEGVILFPWSFAIIST